MDITHITSLLGGIALFLYGMSIMGAGLVLLISVSAAVRLTESEAVFIPAVIKDTCILSRLISIFVFLLSLLLIEKILYFRAQIIPCVNKS